MFFFIGDSAGWKHSEIECWNGKIKSKTSRESSWGNFCVAFFIVILIAWNDIGFMWDRGMFVFMVAFVLYPHAY